MDWTGVDKIIKRTSNIPNFETARLLLREVTEDDVPSYETHFVDYEVIRQLNSLVPWPYPKGGVLDYVRTEIMPKQGNNHWVWAITLRACPEEMIGSIGLWRKGKPENRGFFLGRKFWGQGIMTEAVVPITDYAFDVLGFETLIFNNAVGNIRSRRIKEKTGARLLRIEPAKFVDPALTEQEVWELTSKEWQLFRGL
jgi:RimJ/RimL family protein N-acetyltransferase